jgi:hypothetical protein
VTADTCSRQKPANTRIVEENFMIPLLLRSTPTMDVGIMKKMGQVSVVIIFIRPTFQYFQEISSEATNIIRPFTKNMSDNCRTLIETVYQGC